jgi:hypothetical protein
MRSSTTAIGCRYTSARWLVGIWEKPGPPGRDARVLAFGLVPHYTNGPSLSAESPMKQADLGIILVSSVISFVGIPTSLFAQNQSCISACQTFFGQCLQVCGSNCTTAGISAAITGAAQSNATNPNTTASNSAKSPMVFRNCDSERDLCLVTCQGLPRG